MLQIVLVSSVLGNFVKSLRHNGNARDWFSVEVEVLGYFILKL
jgi:hypothetical protein